METQINTEVKKEKIKLDFKESKYATGRRKKSIARVWVKKGSGNIHVNGKKMVEYFLKANLQTANLDLLLSLKEKMSMMLYHQLKVGDYRGKLVL